MDVYVFGNEDVACDSIALKVANRLAVKGIRFIIVKPNEDLPFEGKSGVVVMDTVAGISKVTLISDEKLDKLILPPRGTAHDFGLGFQIKYLKKLGKLGKVAIIGLPMGKEVDYSSIQSILRKLVAQDIQGS
ncbi:MAG: hypothetical protein ACOX6V_01845 [Patescibacteria group bacterium]|jgi:Ni,Fe-hydrogenase maturation factor